MTPTATIAFHRTYEVITCCVCGQSFAVDVGFYDVLRRDGTTFYCPVGHPQAFDDSTAEQLRRTRATLEQTRDDLARQRKRTAAEIARREEVERSRAALKGNVTKLRKRLGAGVCPYCPRHFTNLEAHIRSKHPGQPLPAENDGDAPHRASP